MDYQVLNTLIQTHPSWPSVDDETLLAWVNEEAITVDRETLSSGEVFATILNNRSEFSTKPATDQQMVRDILYVHSGEGVPTAPGTPARAALVSIFGAGSATITELAAAISQLITRAENAGIAGEVKLGDIEYARTL